MSGWSGAAASAALRTWLLLLVVIGGLVAAMAVLGGTSGERIATNVLVTLVLLLAVQLFMGGSGVVSFGHVAFHGIGAYTAAALAIPTAVRSDLLPSLPAAIDAVETGLPWTLAAGAAVAALVALVLGLVLARMEAAAMAMATLALLVAAHSTFANATGWTRGSTGLYGVPRTTGLTVALVVVAIALAVSLLYQAGPSGMRLRATREDPIAAAALGIDVARARLGAWVLSAAIAGAAGALWGHANLAFGPDQFFFTATFAVLATLVVGGLSSVTGAVVGAVLIGAAAEVLRTLERGMTLGPIALPELPGAVELVTALVTLAVLILRPAGLVPREAVRPRWR